MDIRKRVGLISTGGTIEKTYDAFEGALSNNVSVLDIMLARIVRNGVEIVRFPLMNKDSLHMTDEDHDLIARTASSMADVFDGLVIVHGTDRLQFSGERTYERMPTPRVPVVFTGAMRPFELRNTDAMQNLTEALLAVQLVEPGIYVAMHNRVLRFPGVVKNRETLAFEHVSDHEV